MAKSERLRAEELKDYLSRQVSRLLLLRKILIVLIVLIINQLSGHAGYRDLCVKHLIVPIILRVRSKSGYW